MSAVHGMRSMAGNVIRSMILCECDVHVCVSAPRIAFHTAFFFDSWTVLLRNCHRVLRPILSGYRTDYHTNGSFCCSIAVYIAVKWVERPLSWRSRNSPHNKTHNRVCVAKCDFFWLIVIVFWPTNLPPPSLFLAFSLLVCVYGCVHKRTAT